MTRDQDARREADGARPRSWAVGLALAGLWAGIVPYLGRAVGWRLEVAGTVEVVDHVVPGAVVLLASLALTGAGSGSPAGAGDLRWSAAGGASFLAGFWIAGTHAPLLAEAVDGISPWDATVLHVSAGLPALAVGAAMLVVPFVDRERHR